MSACNKKNTSSKLSSKCSLSSSTISHTDELINEVLTEKRENSKNSKVISSYSLKSSSYFCIKIIIF